MLQTDLETCLRQTNVTQCMVPDSVTDALGSDFERVSCVFKVCWRLRAPTDMSGAHHLVVHEKVSGRKH